MVSIATVQFSGKKRNGERPLKLILFPVLLVSVHGERSLWSLGSLLDLSLVELPGDKKPCYRFLHRYVPSPFGEGLGRWQKYV